MNNDLKIIYSVCLKVLGIDFGKKDRKQNYVFKRWIYFKVARELTDESLTNIGIHVKKDHATVLFGLKKFDFDILTDEHYKNLYDKCLLLAKSSIHQNILKTGSVKDILLHTNINLRHQLRKSEEQLARIPQTIKTKYA